MNGYLKEEHLEMQKAVRRFTEEKIIPIADKLDQEEAEIPHEILDEMGKLGYFGVLIPTEYDGLGLDMVSYVVVTEELSRGWLGVGSVIARNVGTGEVLLHGGNEEQKKKFLPGMATGALQTASAGTEAEAGSDAANIRLKAVRKGNEYVLNGTKMFCTFANRANILFTYARTADVKPKHRGISLFLVEKKPGDQFQPPQLVGNRIRTIGYHGMNTYELAYEDCRVPVANLVGEENRGFYLLMSGYEVARIQFSARSIGVAQAAFEAALKYSKERVQFDQPIAKFQAIRFKLADMATDIALARQFTYYTAAKRDRGERCDLEAGMVKLFAAEMTLKHTWNAVQIHGGYGYTKEFPVNRYWRDAGLLPIGEGTTEIQREIIARRLLGE